MFRDLADFKAFSNVLPDVLAAIAAELTDLVSTRLIVRFWDNEDAQAGLRNALDDYLFDAVPGKGVDLSDDQVDEVISRVIRIGRARFPR